MTTRPSRRQDIRRNDRRANRGFTMVELLIVLAVLALLSAIVIPSVTGMFGRGAFQAYETDSDSLRSVVALFYYDGHACDTDNPGNVWGSATPVFGHHYPTTSGRLPDEDLAGILGDAGSDSGYTFPDSAIWMGLLFNPPSDTSTHHRDTACPLTGEMGPYVNKIPESASEHNYSTAGGSYTWILTSDGNIYGLYWDGSAWQAGCSGSYP